MRGSESHVQVADRGMEEDDGVERGEVSRWRCTLKAVMAGFTDRLDVGGKRDGGVKVHDLSQWAMVHWF